jgi:hypothetical protein
MDILRHLYAISHVRLETRTNLQMMEVKSTFILLSITNKMRHCTIFFIAVNALHVSGSFSAHRQELKTAHTASGICEACLLLQLVGYT